MVDGAEGVDVREQRRAMRQHAAKDSEPAPAANQTSLARVRRPSTKAAEAASAKKVHYRRCSAHTSSSCVRTGCSCESPIPKGSRTDPEPSFHRACAGEPLI